MSGVIQLDHIDTWVFDLDNTLYPAEASIMAQVEKRMTHYVMTLLDLDWEKARTVQKRYWHEYGTTLNGLMTNHAINSADFLDFVHDVDHQVISPDPILADHIAQLKGRKIVFTNGPKDHAINIIERLGLSGLFDHLYDIQASEFIPKPHNQSFEKFNQSQNITPQSTVMFEDSSRNLETAARFGYTTVLIRASHEIPGGETAGPDDHPDHVDYVSDCIRTFLGRYHDTRQSVISKKDVL